MTERIRVLIVDDDHMAVAGLASILATADDIDVVATRADGTEVGDAIATSRPQVVLCDMRMPQVGGLEVVRTYAAHQGAPRFVMMTAFDEDGQVLEAVMAGAAGFLLKDDDPGRIIEAVHAVYAGDSAYSPRAARAVTEWVQDNPGAAQRMDALAKMAELTEREHEFALALVSGATDADLADQFYVAVTTVKSALSSIKAKWGIHNRTQLAVIVARSGLV